ncbi:MAG: Flp pilus assembly complex ATPase component TadA, partial [Candidatus Omnitrophica bacterium]|nr:Flp pilus assembly complex ATPase component TadA [Candidatus Omnitrophota bacterium]
MTTETKVPDTRTPVAERGSKPEDLKKADLHTLLEEMVRYDASDLHLKCGSPPALRLNGVLRKTALSPLEPGDTVRMTEQMMPSQFKEIPHIGSMDFSYAIPGVARYRVNVFHQRSNLSIVIRRVSIDIPKFDDLNLPDPIIRFAELERGIVLVTGVTGSGKSTTLASIINKINQTRNAHIVTIEDPIEFLYKDDRCLINQQELGVDFESFDD